MSRVTEEEQPELVPGLVRAQVKAARTRAAKAAAPVTSASVDPVARVLVDTGLPHLDRTFDYLVPATMADDAVPGSRVKVRFAGKDVDGFVVERAAASEHDGRLQPLRRTVSPVPVLQPQVLELVTRIAARYAGSRGDLLRLAVPPRHATVEQEPAPEAHGAVAQRYDARLAQPWATVEDGVELVTSLAAGAAPRAVWSATPGTLRGRPTWVLQIASAVAATVASGRGVLVIVPNAREAQIVSDGLAPVVERHLVLQADAGPAQRYRDFLAVLRGGVDVVVGTRAAAYAPVRDLGLVILWDDGDDSHEEPRAPYPHVREVLRTRAEIEGAALLVGGLSRTPDAQLLVRTGFARSLAPAREALRAALSVAVAGATDRDLERDPFARSARLPQQVHQLLRAALDAGPVLVQTPRRGYAAALACERCRTAARCATCAGPLTLASPTAPPTCGWCGRAEEAWACRVCGHRGLRAPVVGEVRTAEELGRAFPGARVVASGGDRILDVAPSTPRTIVVATPGAEPPSAEGYAAVVLLDTWLMLARPDLRVREEALRRWMTASAVVHPGGRVLAVGDAADPTLQALVRWDPVGHAERELADRASAHMPPACRVATLTGTLGAVDDAMTVLSLPPGTEVLGPVEHGDDVVRTVLRVPWAAGEGLTDALAELQRLRSARRLDPVRVQVDPVTL
ncbi:putative primosomal protein N' [Nocardioides phosphati]|uniref:Probable replication restart protein PriA n=1 Tax=Nocardioides phosphati TaxID=1867775 RepID=A0ABQ2NHC3_9ACTN|nr:primosomal protein N' [Nocardioides phosphati]GGO91722.1 putative primosomal protein N' [Nocardioides phosphati]